ncbi:MAG: topoisomerase DNA-binding C4 zinc finger domain-containing protein [Thiohalocapsa sp.]
MPKSDGCSVALTRARHAVHLIADYASPSSFLTEILSYAGDIEVRGAAAVEPVHCEESKTGTMVQRTGPYGTFCSCSNYPLCTCKTDACKRCGTGILARQKNSTLYVCNNQNCNHTERACPACKTGRLVERNGRYGPFLGCTNYASGECRRTENL